MKQYNFLSMALIAVLMVLVVSCTPMQYSQGGYEDVGSTGRVYRSGPYGGNGVIVVERDPFTGQYFQVNPGYFGGVPFHNRPYGFGYPAYPHARGGFYRGGGTTNNRVTNRPITRQQQPQRSPSPTTNKAKEIIRGGNQ